MVKTLWRVETYGELRGFVVAGNKKSAYKQAKTDKRWVDTIWWNRGRATNLKVTKGIYNDSPRATKIFIPKGKRR